MRREHALAASVASGTGWRARAEVPATVKAIAARSHGGGPRARRGSRSTPVPSRQGRLPSLRHAGPIASASRSSRWPPRPRPDPHRAPRWPRPRAVRTTPTPALDGKPRCAASRRATSRGDQRAQADRQGKAGMAEPRHKDQIQQLRRGEHADGDLHRRADVLTGVEAGGQHLHGDDPEQADTITLERKRRSADIAIRECPIVVEDRHQRLRKDQQRGSARQGQHQHRAQPPVEHRRVAVAFAPSLRRRELRQQHDPECHAEQSRRELHQPVGIGQPGHGPDGDMRRDLGVDQKRKLRHRDTQHRRGHLAQDGAGAGVAPRGSDRCGRQADARQLADARQRRDLNRQLEHAAKHHTAAESQDRLDSALLEPRRAPPGRRNGGQVQQHRCCCRYRKPTPGVQHAGRQRHQRHEADVREHQPGQQDGGVELRQPGAHHPDQHRRADHPHGADHQQRPGEHGCHGVDQARRGGVAVASPGRRQQRHKGLRKRALGEQPAEEIRDPERDVEGVCGRAGAKGCRDQELAHKA